MRLGKWLVMLVVALLMAVPSAVGAQQKKSAQKTQVTTKKPAAKKNTAKPAAKKNAVKPAAKPQTKRLSRAEYEKQQRDLQKQISATEKMISENDQSVLAQNRDIELRKDEIGKRRALLVSMQREIEAIRDEEDSLSQTIVSLGEEYKVKQEKFSKAVKHAFKWRSGYDEWMFVLSANDLMTGVRRMRYIREYTEWRKQEAFLLEQQRQQTDSVKQQLARTRADREKLRGALEKERQVLANKQRVQEEAVAKLQKRNRELKGELASAQKQQREIQKKIQQLIEEERKKAAEAASKSKKKTGGKKEPSSAYYTPSEVAQLTGSFKQNKGKMPYPLDANFAFLSHYSANGNYSINLSTAVGAHACAIFEGTVVRVARSSEDYTIILSHGDYMSVYSNLSAANVKEGQKVKMRQHIGTVKADIDNRRAQLMFWIYGKNDAENPELWLRK